MRRVTAFPETALIIEVPEAEHLVSRFRNRYDPLAARGVPAHITALFPFASLDALDEDMILKLRRIASDLTEFEFELDALDEFVGVLWLRPTPAAPFRELTRRLCEAFADFPPYDGRHQEVIPHLTVAGVAPGPAQRDLRTRLDRSFAHDLPLRCRARALSVFAGDGNGRWRRHHEWPFRATTSPRP